MLVEEKGYNITTFGGRKVCEGPFRDKKGANNGHACLSEDEARYIKSHRDTPAYLLYDLFSEKISYEAFLKVYQDKTYKNIKPAVPEYPNNASFSAQFTSNNKLDYDEVVELRKLYAKIVPWKEVYKQYKDRYPDKWTFWNIYYGNRYKLVMPEVFTKENKKAHSHLKASGESNGRAKMAWEQVDKIRHDFETGAKTRKELYQEYPF